MFQISIKNTHQQKKPTTPDRCFFWKMGPPGDCWKIKHHQNSVEFSFERFWSCFFAEIFSFWMLDEKRQGEDDFWFNPTAGVRDPQGWYLSEELDGAISERQCFRQDFFVFEMIILHAFCCRVVWMSETTMIEIYVCTSLHEHSCNCNINASEIGLFIKQSLSGVMLGKVELHPTLGGCMNRWPSLP